MLSAHKIATLMWIRVIVPVILDIASRAMDATGRTVPFLTAPAISTYMMGFVFVIVGTHVMGLYVSSRASPTNNLSTMSVSVRVDTLVTQTVNAML